MRTFNPWDGCAFGNVLYMCRDYLPLQRFWSKLVVITIPCESYISLPTIPRFCPFIAFLSLSPISRSVKVSPDPTLPSPLWCQTKRYNFLSEHLLPAKSKCKFYLIQRGNKQSEITLSHV